MDSDKTVNYDSSGSAYNSPTLPMTPYGIKANEKMNTDFHDPSKAFSCEEMQQHHQQQQQRSALSNMQTFDNPSFKAGQFMSVGENNSSFINRQFPSFHSQHHDENFHRNQNHAARIHTLDASYYGYGHDNSNTENANVINYQMQHGGGAINSNKSINNKSAVPIANSFNFVPYYSKNVRRSETINLAFSAVRNCIPNVSKDTKLSKIQTLRLAISYIRFLMTCVGDYRFMMLMSEEDKKAFDSYFHTRQFIPQIHANKNEKKSVLKYEKVRVSFLSNIFWSKNVTKMLRKK